MEMLMLRCHTVIWPDAFSARFAIIALDIQWIYSKLYVFPYNVHKTEPSCMAKSLIQSIWQCTKQFYAESAICSAKDTYWTTERWPVWLHKWSMIMFFFVQAKMIFAESEAYKAQRARYKMSFVCNFVPPVLRCFLYLLFFFVLHRDRCLLSMRNNNCIKCRVYQCVAVCYNIASSEN